jgi:chemotaxis protein CheC
MPLLIDVRKLTVINQLIKDGATSVACSLSTLAGVDATVDIKSLSFVDPVDMPAEIGTEKTYSARIRLSEPPYGVFMMTFPSSTAREIAELMTGQPCDEEMTDFHRSAIQEMCNILTSGFIDGIANTLETTIDMGTPTLDYSGGEELSEQALSHVRMDATAIVLDSVVDVADEDTSFGIRIFLVPDPGSFVNMIDRLDIDVGNSERDQTVES